MGPLGATGMSEARQRRAGVEDVSDVELVNQLVEGKRAAFPIFYHRYARLIRHCITKRTQRLPPRSSRPRQQSVRTSPPKSCCCRCICSRRLQQALRFRPGYRAPSSVEQATAIAGLFATCSISQRSAAGSLPGWVRQ